MATSILSILPAIKAESKTYTPIFQACYGSPLLQDTTSSATVERSSYRCGTVFLYAAYRATEDRAHSIWLVMDCGYVRIPRSQIDSWVQGSRKIMEPQTLDVYDGAQPVLTGGHPSIFVRWTNMVRKLSRRSGYRTVQTAG